MIINCERKDIGELVLEEGMNGAELLQQARDLFGLEGPIKLILRGRRVANEDIFTKDVVRKDLVMNLLN